MSKSGIYVVEDYILRIVLKDIPLKSSDNLKLDETSRLNFFLRIRQNKK
jgi:hypothetical protein